MSENKELIAFIRSAMRRASSRWKPIWQTKLAARRPYLGNRRNQKYVYECCLCKKHYPNSKIQVDHIIPVGAFSKLDDIQGFVQRLFCEAHNLQVLCKECHKRKTNCK